MLTIHQSSRQANSENAASVGLAIAGGGPLGAVYELGALQALEDSIDGLELHRLDVYVGVSVGAFTAASLANGIPLRTLCRIFLGDQHAEPRFNPERFLQPAYREYFRRAARVPGILTDCLLDFLRYPMKASIPRTLSQLGKAIPGGLFDNESIHEFLAEVFSSEGRTNRFEELSCRLFVVAVNLDTGAVTRFGSAGFTDVPISRAVQASAALPGMYPPVRIGQHDYVDGALRRTLNASAALAEGVDLLLGINPLVPFDTRDSDTGSRISERRLADGGLPMILSQTFRALIQSRVKVGFDKYRADTQSADLVLLEPDRGDELIFFTNIFSYSSRKALCEHAYEITRRNLLARKLELEPLLARHGLTLNLERLSDSDRTLEKSIGVQPLVHARVGKRLATALDSLESLIGRAV